MTITSTTTIQTLIDTERLLLGASAHDDGPDGSDTTQLGERTHKLMLSQAFLDAGKASNVWFEVTPEVERAIREAADDEEDVNSIVADIKRAMASVNQVLARSDMTDAEKLTFLSGMLGTFDGNYDDGVAPDQAWRGLGAVFAQVMAGDVEALFAWDDLDPTEMSAMATSLDNEAKSTWLQKNEIAVKEDTSKGYFADLRMEEVERRKRRANLSPEELALDFAMEEQDRRQSYLKEQDRLAAGYRKSVTA